MQQGVSDSAADGERARIALSRRGRRFDGGPDDPALHRVGLVRVANVDQFAIPVGPHAGEYQPAGPAIHSAVACRSAAARGPVAFVVDPARSGFADSRGRSPDPAIPEPSRSAEVAKGELSGTPVQ